MRGRVLALLALVAGCATSPEGGHWPQWRGPRRDNISTETGLLERWPAEGPPLSWEVTGLGAGNASLAVDDGRIVTLSDAAGHEYVVALDEGTGRLLWATCLGKIVQARMTSMRWLGQRTPTLDGDRLYAYRAEGELICLRARDGAVLWRKDTIAEWGARRHAWGLCDYPLVDAGRVICTVGGDRPSLVALDREDGRVLWRTFTREAATGSIRGEYGAVVVAEVAGRRQFIASLRHGTFGFAADDGRLLWESASGLEGGAHSSTPLVVGDAVWTSWRWKGGLSLLELTRKPDGIQVTPGYSRKFEFYTFQDSAICLDNHVYGFGPTSSLHCFNLWTGDAVWGPVRLDGTANCSMVLADGRLYVVANTGTVLLGTPSPEGLTEESRFKIPRFRRDIATTNPVVAGGHLYLRDDQRLLRFDVRRGAEARPPGRVELDLGRGVVAHVSNRAVFVPTPYDVVEKMMDAANVGKDDVVYDLGSGDGRILVSAARRGARATGIEIDPDLVRISRENAARAGFADRVRIEPADLLTAEMSTASVVALYLPESFLERLKPKFAGLKPGTRIVSHQVRIPKVRVDGERTFESPEDGVLHRLYLYTCPLTEVP